MPIDVKVSKLGLRTATLRVEDGDTVEVVLSAAGVDAAKSEIRVNGNPATTATEVRSTEERPVPSVTVVPQIRGGQQ